MPSPALVIAVAALFVSLGGTAVAAGVVPLAEAGARRGQCEEGWGPRRRRRSHNGGGEAAWSASWAPALMLEDVTLVDGS